MTHLLENDVLGLLELYAFLELTILFVEGADALLILLTNGSAL